MSDAFATHILPAAFLSCQSAMGGTSDKSEPTPVFMDGGDAIPHATHFGPWRFRVRVLEYPRHWL